MLVKILSKKLILIWISSLLLEVLKQMSDFIIHDRNRFKVIWTQFTLFYI